MKIRRKLQRTTRSIEAISDEIATVAMVWSAIIALTFLYWCAR
jgi:hypothetical protein